MSLMLYSINKWTNVIAQFPLLLEILGNMCIAVLCFPDCNVITDEINLIFLMKLFFYMTKKSRQKSKYFDNEKKLLRWNQKDYSFLNGLQLPKIVLNLRV